MFQGWVRCPALGKCLGRAPHQGLQVLVRFQARGRCREWVRYLGQGMYRAVACRECQGYLGCRVYQGWLGYQECREYQGYQGYRVFLVWERCLELVKFRGWGMFRALGRCLALGADQGLRVLVRFQALGRCQEWGRSRELGWCLLYTSWELRVAIIQSWR
jgi:hypothetical protein